MTSHITIDRGVGVPMPDGVMLAADVHHAGDRARPVLLQRTPYDRGNALSSFVYGLVEPIVAVERGFTVVIQDVRGRWGSEGEFRPFRDEAVDGAATIAWIREQPWCDGRVAMYGMSYVGATQLLAAGTRPEGLVAIAPALTAADYFDGWVYEHGVFQLGFAMLWSLTDLAPSDLVRRPQDHARLAPALAALQNDLPGAFGAVAAPEFAEIAPWVGEWLEHPRRDAYWNEISPSAHHADVAVPALHLGGWYDIFLRGTIANFAGLREHAATDYARHNQRMVIGPWSHGNLSDAVGDLHLGLGAAMASLDLNSLHLDFFTAALDGAEVPGPPVRVFVLGENAWSDETEWPPNDVAPVTMYLCDTGLAFSASRDASERSYVYRPDSPTPTLGGRTFLPGLLSSLNSGMKEQSSLWGRQDGLLYLSDELTAPLLVMGNVIASLVVTTDGADLDLVVKLLDVHPDGRSFNLCEGVRRASADPAVRPAGRERLRLDVDLAGIANRFAAGHRIGIWVGSASYPQFAPNTSTTGQLGPARVTILHDPAEPSTITMDSRAL